MISLSSELTVTILYMQTADTRLTASHADLCVQLNYGVASQTRDVHMATKTKWLLLGDENFENWAISCLVIPSRLNVRLRYCGTVNHSNPRRKLGTMFYAFEAVEL